MDNGSSVSPGPHTFTVERVEQQLRNDTMVEGADVDTGPFSSLCLEFAFENGVQHHLSDQQRKQCRESFCRKLYNEVGDPKSHVQRLDDLYSELVVCNFEFGGGSAREVLISDACGMLRRLPATPPNLPEDTSLVDAAYFLGVGSHSETPNTHVWQGLQVASHISTNVIRVAFMAAQHQSTLAPTIVRSFIDATADLMSTASRLSGTADTPNDRTRWLLVRSFLWTSWQRSSMLFFHSIVSGYIRSGFKDITGHYLTLRSFYPKPGLSMQEMSRRFSNQEKPDSMCGWAFELLRSDPCALGSDFRRFHQRFSMSSIGLSARCIAGQEISCKGDRSDSCQRFKGMRIEDQSMHDYTCRRNCPSDCPRLTWDEALYRSVSGARAVNINTRFDARNLEYCNASEETLAISHVWSHGQGGRPESGHGINRCLHLRYSAIAESLGCDLYWMDTPCIPEDHQLRKEAIQNINKIFEQSKAMLVCDRDLMSIEATNVTIEVRESILVTLMVCDWNLRAWTFLEAFRGRNKIYALCKHNKVISLKETIEIVHRKGCIDIGLMLLTIPHLLPASYGKGVKFADDAFVSGFLTIEGGGSHLSHRQASRPGDDIVIWSLLIDDDAYSDAKAFWRAQKGKFLRTSYLLSSAPRLKTPGLTWAPSSPAAQLLLDADSSDSAHRLLASIGDGSVTGLISQHGFQALWRTYVMLGGLEVSGAISYKIRGWNIESLQDKPYKDNIRSIREKYMRNYIYGALLRPKVISHGYPEGDPSKIFVGICGTNKFLRWPWTRVRWTWLGVYEWNMKEPLPEFTRSKNVLLT